MAGSPSPSSSDEPLAVGSVLDDRYRIDGVLGTGGMGRVYRAEHTKIGRSVAIKVLHADLGRNREASQRFQREAIASGRLDHPNIVGVSDFGVLGDGACYLVMEILEGESLADRLEREHRIHWTAAIEILRGVLYGLRHAHERGVVHRDIKPDNVFLARKDGDPVVKILDFGIAKLYAGREDDPASTRAGLTVGTPAYLSPEQAVGGEITPASDLYSASVVLYEMLAGRAPFEDRDPLAMLGAHVSRRPPGFAVVAPGVEIPPALEAIVQRGLVKAAADRIRNASEFLAALDGFAPPLHAMPRSGIFPTWTDARAARSPGPARASDPANPGIGRDGDLAAARGPTAPGPSPALGAPLRDGSLATEPIAPSMVATAPSAPLQQPPPSPTAASRSSSAGAASATPGAMSAPLARPTRRRATSLADLGEPIPLSWIVRSAVVTGLVITAAIALAIATHCAGPTRGGDREPQLTGLLRELERGKTCAERRAAVTQLIELRDRRAIPPLKLAHDRSAGGDDSNACLRAEAERALQVLTAAP
jgi:serine/threonine-protein kinase